MLTSICVYCGSSDTVPAHYLDAGSALGAALALAGITLIYGGGRTGLMGRVADGVLANGGTVIGVIPVHLNSEIVAHRGLTRLEVVASMHARKQRMAELADGFIAAPGGIGTLEELAEILTWAQLGLHAKPIGILEVDGYWAPLLAWIDRAVADGFLAPAHRGLVRVASAPDALVAALISGS